MAIQTVPANPAVSQNIYGSWTNPNANLDIYKATNVPAYQNILQNPYFIQALATAGESLDPEGPAGYLGRAAKSMVSSRQAARANELAITDDNKRYNELKDKLDLLGGITPKGMPGASGVSMGADGSWNIKMDSQTPVQVKPAPKAPDRDTSTSIPQGAMQSAQATQAPQPLLTTPSAGAPVATAPVAPVQQSSGYDASAPSPMELAPPSAVRRQRLGPVPATSIGPTRSQSYGNVTDIIPFYQAPLRSRRVR